MSYFGYSGDDDLEDLLANHLLAAREDGSEARKGPTKEKKKPARKRPTTQPEMASGLPTYARANANFQVQLVRKGDGTVVYMECDHDLLAQLSAFLHLPIGTMGAQLSSTAPNLGLVKFGCSIAGLRDAVWSGKKQGMLPNSRPPSSATVKTQRLETDAIPKCLCSAGVKSRQRNGYCNFCGLQGRHMGGYHHQQQQQELCQTCNVCENCTQTIFASARKGVKMVDDRSALAVLDKAPKLPQFKDTVKFLVDNELQVFENSSVKALQLLSVAQVNLADITTEERSVTKDEVNKLVAHMFFNSKAILTGVFPVEK